MELLRFLKGKWAGYENYKNWFVAFQPCWRRMTPPLCRVYTDEGIYGDGEVALSYGGASRAAFGMLQDLQGIWLVWIRWNMKLFGRHYIKMFLGQEWRTDCFWRNQCFWYCIMGYKGKSIWRTSLWAFRRKASGFFARLCESAAKWLVRWPPSGPEIWWLCQRGKNCGW